MFKLYLTTLSLVLLSQTSFTISASAQSSHADIFEGLDPHIQTKSTNPDIVVELFTSQGCSSCPAANKFTSKLSTDPEKLILTYGVTYWDYLGWKDTFGRPEFTDRQRAYGRALHIGNVYTPQIVLNGSAHSPRYSRKDVDTMTLNPKRPIIELHNSQTGLMVRLPKEISPNKVQIALISYVPGKQEVNVSRGENQGRTLSVANVVTNVTTFSPQSQFDISTQILPQKGYAYASLVHDIETGKIITAARYNP